MNRAVKRLTLLAALGLAVALPAQAQRYSSIDGTKLIGLCTGRNKADVEECTSYITGLSDAATFYQELLPADGSKGGKLPAYICVPNQVTGVQMRQSVVDWAKTHQNDLKRQASGVVLRALRDTYACR